LGKGGGIERARTNRIGLGEREDLGNGSGIHSDWWLVLHVEILVIRLTINKIKKTTERR
jgi:hypothetical protein